MFAERPNLYLVGFTGTGKSTVGRHAARELGFEFVDSDHVIEATTGRTIPQIFAEEGEAGFRSHERKFMEGGHPSQGCVVACGGGLIVPAGMLELVKASGVVVCLHAPLAVVLERTARSAHRPLLQVDDRAEKLRTMFAAREAVYRQTGTMVLTDGRPMREIVAHVVRVYRTEEREWKPSGR